MSAATLCGQAVIAILPSGSYAVAGRTDDMTADQATELMERTSLGSVHLKAGRPVLAVMGVHKGTRYLIGAAPGEARDPSGRPWVYRRVIVANDDAFESIGFNPFAIEHELLRQQRFLDHSALPPVDLLEMSDRSPEFEQRCLLGSGPSLGAAVSSILRGRPVLWSNCNDALALIRASYVLLPSWLRARLTFSSDAAAWPQLRVQVIASTHALHGPDPLAPDREEIDLKGVTPPGAPNDPAQHLWNRMAATVFRWIERNDLTAFAEWRRVAGAFLEELPRQAPWPEVVATLERAWVCAEAIVAPSEERPWGHRFAGRIRSVHEQGIRPPSVVLASLIAEAQDATVDDLLLTLKACRPIELGSLSAEVAKKLVAASLTDAAWNAFLASANDLAAGAGAQIAEAAAPMLMKTGYHEPFIRAVSTRAPGGWMWARAFRAAWDVDPTPWNPLILLRGTLYVDEEYGHTTPDAAFLRRVRDHYRTAGVEPGPVAELLHGLAEADDAPDLAAAGLVTLIPCSADLGDLCARAFMWLLSQQQTRADLNTVLDRIRQAGPTIDWMREGLSHGSDSASAIDRAAVALLTLDAPELDLTTADTHPDTSVAQVVRLVRSAARCCGVFAFPGPLVATFGCDEPVGGGAWIVEELNDKPSVVEELVVSRVDVQLFDRIARFAGSAGGGGLSAVARGSLLRAALILAARTGPGRDALANWVRCIVRPGIRLVPDDRRLVFKEQAGRAELGSVAAETVFTAVEILDASEARELVHDLAMMIGLDGRRRWFERSSKSVARELAALQELCRANRARGAPPLQATMILRGVGRAEGLPWWLRYGIWRLLPRAWLGARKLGFK